MSEARTRRQRFDAYPQPYDDMLRIFVVEHMPSGVDHMLYWHDILRHSGHHADYNDVRPVIERAWRVAERLERSTFAVQAAELEPDGLERLALKCWKEDERDYDATDP